MQTIAWHVTSLHCVPDGLVDGLPPVNNRHLLPKVAFYFIMEVYV